MGTTPRFILAVAGHVIATAALVTMPASAKTTGKTRDAVDKVVLHTIGGPECKSDKVLFTNAGGKAASWQKFFDDHDTLGIHYIVDREGTVTSGIPENQIANHAKGHNAKSIGIELVNKGDGDDPFSKAQIDALVKLLKKVAAKWSISTDDIVTHSSLDKRTFQCAGKAVKLKQDPGSIFPLTKVRQRVAGSE